MKRLKSLYDIVLLLDETSYPYIIFPEEIWLMIITASEKSHLPHLFQAFPKFFDTFGKYVDILVFIPNKAGQVYKWDRTSVKVSDVNKLVSRDWCEAVEYFVSSQSLEKFYRNFQYALPDEPIERPALMTFETLHDVMTFRELLKPSPQHHLLLKNSLGNFSFEEEYLLDFDIHSVPDIFAWRGYLRSKYLRRVIAKPISCACIPVIMNWMAENCYNVPELVIDNKSDSMFCSSYEIIPTLSCVKYLELTYSPRFTYQFLKGFTSLEHLRINYAKHTPVKTMDEILFPRNDRLTVLVDNYVCQEKVSTKHNGDIWTVLPSLESLVVVEGSICKHYLRSLKNKPLVFHF